jgi:hypothetical protein
MIASRAPHLRRLAVPVVLSLFIWGCGGESDDSGTTASQETTAEAEAVDTKGVETGLKRAITSPGTPGVPSLGGPGGVPGTPGVPGFTTTSVDCPSGVELKKGKSFKCDLVGKSDRQRITAVVEVTEKDNKGDVMTYKGAGFSGGPIKSASGKISVTADPTPPGAVPQPPPPG